MNKLFALLRLCNLLIITIVFFFLALFIIPYISRKYQGYISKFWARLMLFSLGIKLKFIGNLDKEYIKPNAMVIANHISWIDIPVLYYLYSVSFIGKIEMLKWPILRTLIKGGGTIFIDRNKKRNLISINHQVSKKLVAGATVCLFPEGRTSDGSRVLPFKAPILEAAIIAKSTVIPIVIKYYRKNDTRSTEVAYPGKNLFQVLFQTLSLNGLNVEIHLLPHLDAKRFQERNELSSYLYEQFIIIYNQPKVTN